MLLRTSEHILTPGLLHPYLQRVALQVSTRLDFSIIESKRSMERQRELVKAGTSWTLNSKHVMDPCQAIDILPVLWINGKPKRIGWKDEHFEFYMGRLLGAFALADDQDRLRFGWDWNSDLILEEKNPDLVHIEMK